MRRSGRRGPAMAEVPEDEHGGEHGDEHRDEHRDELPADLDVTRYVGMYTFPDIRRRRAPAVAYLILAALLGLLVATHPGHRVLVNGGFLAAAIVLGLIGIY